MRCGNNLAILTEIRKPFLTFLEVHSAIINNVLSARCPMTYGNFTGGYRPHLDSADFLKVLRSVVSCAFLLAVVFSIKGASAGMKMVLNTNLLLAISIAAGLTATAASLAFSSFVFSFSRAYRWGFRGVAVVIFVCLSALNYLGFEVAEEQGKADAVLEHPEVLAYDRDIADLVTRQNQYGISLSEKQSLLAREKETRRAKQELIDRLRHDKAVNPSVAARALGENEKAVRLVLAMSPDVMIAVLLPLLAQLFGAVGIPVSKGVSERPAEKQVVYMQPTMAAAPASSYQPAMAVQSNGQAQTPATMQPTSSGTNGKADFAPIGVNEQPAPWNPF